MIAMKGAYRGLSGRNFWHIICQNAGIVLMPSIIFQPLIAKIKGFIGEEKGKRGEWGVICVDTGDLKI